MFGRAMWGMVRSLTHELLAPRKVLGGFRRAVATASLRTVRPLALALLLAVSACGGAARGYSAFLQLEGGADDGSADDGTDEGGGDGSADDADPVGPPACAVSSCKSCVLGTASCSSAGACQCCAGSICLPN
jgi:hypothetical protein